MPPEAACVTLRTVARIVSSKFVNALGPTIETPIITVELRVTPADDSGVPVPVFAVLVTGPELARNI